MNASNCSYEWLSNTSVGIALAVIALGFTVIGVTVLPVVGLLPAAAAAVGSAFFISAPRSPECRIS